MFHGDERSITYQCVGATQTIQSLANGEDVCETSSSAADQQRLDVNRIYEQAALSYTGTFKCEIAEAGFCSKNQVKDKQDAIQTIIARAWPNGEVVGIPNVHLQGRSQSNVK